MRDRVRKLKESLAVENYPLCIEKFKLLTASFKETAGEVHIIRRTKALANILENIPIFIEDDELIVGNVASKPMGLEVDADYGFWSQDEIDALKKEGYSISKEDENELKRLNENFQGKTLVGAMGDLLDSERLWSFMQSGVILPPWKNKKDGSGGGYAQGGMGLGPGLILIGIEFDKVLNEGLEKLISDAEAELENLRFIHPDSKKKVDFLKSAIIAFKSIIHFANRFSQLAREMAEKEVDAKRKKELEKISDICSWVPANPARNFYEAIQSFWFIFLMITPSPTATAGRFDQYMYPFYKKDIENKVLTDEDVVELLECLRVKDMQLNRTSGKVNRQKNSGMAKWHNWTIGGVTSEGKDATNELSYLILEAAKDCITPHYTITVRVHDQTPEEFMLKALEVVKTGMGMPAFIGDKSYINFFVNNGASLEDARNYIVTGCLDGNIPGKSRTVAVGMFIVPLVYDIFWHNGIDPNTGLQVGIKTGDPESFTSFDEFVVSFKQQLKHFMGLAAERNNMEMLVNRELFPEPVRSSLTFNGLKEGKDLYDRTMPFENGAVLNPVGMINVVDSLAAIKKNVFEDKKVSMQELQTALKANWKGYEELHKMFLKAPKYGNGDDYVDTIANELYQFWAETTAEFGTVLGGKNMPTAISITSHQPGGLLTGATPDGRYASEVLADGTMSPMRGKDTNGPTGVLKSALAINQDPYQATLLNLKFHPTALQKTADLKKLLDLIKTYFDLGGKHVQFNVVDKEMLMEAQEHPEQHRDLIVRVAGYSAYFVQLSKEMQDEIIGRNEHELSA